MDSEHKDPNTHESGTRSAGIFIRLNNGDWQPVEVDLSQLTFKPRDDDAPEKESEPLTFSTEWSATTTFTLTDEQAAEWQRIFDRWQARQYITPLKYRWLFGRTRPRIIKVAGRAVRGRFRRMAN